ncbi:glycosyltransferase family 2 protein [Novosphingobium sp. SL115]|uniref:glycosyltransferase family 2 protein n=1 Tax=Novosphingobium sp. SL115 TaxID=2995150 RepID=UPI0022737961|nr:glycosyltransferase family 2 protein [Novosphingobium sp. SL115]MCY1670962.1 glycosyltransferase family 2 protein [Novosphingobium sp. SL115]
MAFAVAKREALAGLGNIARGKRVRGWNMLCRAASRHGDYYRRWAASAEPDLIKAWCGVGGSSAPVLAPCCIIIGAPDDSAAALRSANSLRLAFGKNCVILTCGVAVPGCVPIDDEGAGTLRQVFLTKDRAGSTPAWIIPVRAGDGISPLASAVIGAAVQKSADASVLFWDSDQIIAGGRSDPWIKGEWDVWHYLARDSLSGACAISGKAVDMLPAEILDVEISLQSVATALMLLVAGGVPHDPVHIPMVLSHAAVADGFVSQDQWRQIVGNCWSEPIEFSQDPARSRFLDPQPPAPVSWPSVSIIVPTRDKAHLLRACVAGLDLLDYPGRTELVIVDNGSAEADALSLVEELEQSGRAIVLRDDGPFNFSALNNRAVARSSGDVLCLLNNDVEATDGQWLASLVRFALRSDIGAVGPTLTYPDGTIQHAGVAIGIGDAAGHVSRHAMPGMHEHLAWHGALRSVSAVTAACLVVRREAYMNVGGLDADAFAVAFNDVDFCLKLQAAGLRNLYVPSVSLIHHESVSRGSDYAPANLLRFNGELSRFQARWRSAEWRDPHYSPLFSRSSEQCLLTF